MVIKLPQTQPLSSFVYNSEVGNLTYKGPEVVGLLDVSQGIGNIKIMAPLFSQNLRLSCNMGDVSIQEQCLVSERVSLKLNMGTGKVIGKGAIVGYSVLEASGNMGDFVMNLRPGVLDSKMDVSCSTGSVKLNVSGFEGIFNIKSTVGSVKVTAPGDITCSKNPCEGIVGEDDAKGALNVITNVSLSLTQFTTLMTHYDLLRVAPNADQETIKRQYVYEGYEASDPEHFRLLTLAFLVVTNDQKKYDFSLFKQKQQDPYIVPKDLLKQTEDAKTMNKIYQSAFNDVVQLVEVAPEEDGSKKPNRKYTVIGTVGGAAVGFLVDSNAKVNNNIGGPIGAVAGAVVTGAVGRAKDVTPPPAYQVFEKLDDEKKREIIDRVI
ncbi:hypothetical protein HDU99_005439, partial [Rhizoclosmatium hyalinum]